jgi:uncharacterized protein
MLQCSSLILKVASRCNLNCSYCYMYNLGDNTYKNQPKVMSDNVVKNIIHKVKNHCLKHKKNEFLFVFHGGEPLLCGIDFFKDFINVAEDILFPEIVPVFAMQTNATLITDEWCEFFVEKGIMTSFSLDGYKEINDENRVYHNGKGSFEDIVKGIKLIKKYEPLKKRLAVLSVINLNANQAKLLEFFNKNEIYRFDVLLPDSNYKTLPSLKNDFTNTIYGEWLCNLFDVWYQNYQNIEIKFFTNIINNILGGNSSTDAYGAGINELLVIETDGSIEAVDVLKICGEGFTKEGYNIVRNEIDDSFNADLINKFIHANENLPTKCVNCSLNTLCGGGYLPHRFDLQNSFNNPTIYCHDLAKIITHIQNTILKDIPDEVRTEAALEEFTYQDFLTEYNNN